MDDTAATREEIYRQALERIAAFNDTDASEYC